MSLFGGLYVGASGLKTSQNALNTVAHNLSNVNTTGYTRQQVAESDVNYTTISTSQAIANTQIGDGVRYSECRRVRNSFLDEKFRQVNGRYSFYDVSYSAIAEVEDILGELDGAAFKSSLEGLWTAIEELAKSPSDSTYISLLVSKAASFAENATAVYTSFQEYQSNLNSQIKSAVDTINGIGARIAELNNEIAAIECGGVENANDLRDERDLLLDTLSEYGPIKYEEDETGRLSVRFNNVDFVSGKNAYEIGMLQDLETGFYTPYWKQNVLQKKDANGEIYLDYSSAYMFDLTEDISTDAGTDVGGLRAMLLARGDHVANYTDLQTGTMTQQKLDSLGITFNQYNEKEGLTYYNDYISKSVMMNMEAEFDNIVHYVATVVNQVLADNADPKSGYLCNDDGTPIQLFQKTNTEAYTKVTYNGTAADTAAFVEAQNKEAGCAKYFQIYDENGDATNQYWVFVEENPELSETRYGANNLKINAELVQVPTKLGFVKEDDSSDYSLGKAFIAAFEENQLFLNPNATKESTFESCYIDLVSQVATSGDVYQSLYDFQQLSAEQIEANRQSYVGVSSDEELERMIMYQNAYNAASRYINVINTMLDSLISIGA